MGSPFRHPKLFSMFDVLHQVLEATIIQDDCSFISPLVFLFMTSLISPDKNIHQGSALISLSLSQAWVQCHGPSTLRSILFGRGARATPAPPESTGPSTSLCLSPSSTWLSTSPTMVSFSCKILSKPITLSSVYPDSCHQADLFICTLRQEQRGVDN